MRIGEQQYLLEFSPTDRGDPAQHLFDNISNNPYFSLDQEFGGSENLEFYLQTKGIEECRVRIDLKLRQALEQFYRIQIEFTNFLRLRLGLSEKDLELSARVFVKTLLKGLVVDCNSGQTLEEAVRGKTITVQRDFFTEEILLGDFLSSEIVKQSAPVSLRDPNRLVVQDSEQKAMNCEHLDCEIGSEHSDNAIVVNGEFSDSLESMLLKAIDKKIRLMDSEPLMSIEELENNLFGPVEFELLEQFLLHE